MELSVLTTGATLFLLRVGLRWLRCQSRKATQAIATATATPTPTRAISGPVGGPAEVMRWPEGSVIISGDLGVGMGAVGGLRGSGGGSGA